MVFPALPADECFKHQSSPCSGSFIFLVDGGVLGYQLPQWAWFVRAIKKSKLKRLQASQGTPIDTANDI